MLHWPQSCSAQDIPDYNTARSPAEIYILPVLTVGRGLYVNLELAVILLGTVMLCKYEWWKTWLDMWNIKL